ncbi:MAG: hypothetical protein AAFQ89_23960 [Cyanobacteria bacterium J06626_18]
MNIPNSNTANLDIAFFIKLAIAYSIRAYFLLGSVIQNGKRYDAQSEFPKAERWDSAQAEFGISPAATES